MVNITIDAHQMARLERTLAHIKNGVPRALAPAINRALDKGRTEVRREIRKVYVIKQKDIPISVRGANRASLSGAIILRQGMLSLADFKHKGGTGKRPLFGQVKVGGGGVIARGFVPFRYSGIPYKRMGDSRLPIRKILTIGAPIMASQPTVGPAVNKAMGETLGKRIDHEMERVLATAGR